LSYEEEKAAEEKYGCYWRLPEGSIERVRATVAFLYTCCWNQRGPAEKVEPSELVEVVALSRSFPAEADETAYGIIQMRDGRYLALEEGADYTGHG
jgi:hypothetical protein